MHSGIRFVWAAICLSTATWAAPADQSGVEFFENKIRPVFASRCFFCHSAKAAQVQGGLRLDTPAGIRQGGNSGPAIQAGDPDKSLLLRAVRYQDKELKMPPGKALPAEVVADIESWIRSGAPLPADAAPATQTAAARTFWAFQVPKRISCSRSSPRRLARQRPGQFHPVETGTERPKALSCGGKAHPHPSRHL